MMRTSCAALAACAIAAMIAPLEAQEIERSVRGAPDGKVRMTFATRPGVCGDGEHVTTRRSSRDESDWECQEGPARVVLTKADGRITHVRVYVGGRWRAATENVTDLGTVPAPEAAEYLLELAREDDAKVGRQAILPATLADSVVVWDDLLEIAQDDRVSERTRLAALQWVGIEASRTLDTEAERSGPRDDDREARERAVFAISQLPHDQAVPRLLSVASTHRFAHVRQKALFWLGQTGDPRAIELFEQMLRTRE